MSEQTLEDGPKAGGDEAPQTFTQDQVNAILAEERRKARDRFADYSSLKEKASKLDQIEKANQTEAEKAAARVAELEAELTNTRRETMRLQVASAHGITDADDIDLFLTGTDQETLTKQAQRLSGRDADRKTNGNHVPREGNNPQPGSDPMREFARGLFKSGD